MAKTTREVIISERIKTAIMSIKIDTLNEILIIANEVKDPIKRTELIKEKTEEANHIFDDIVTKNFKEVKGVLFDYLLDCKLKANKINSAIEINAEEYEIK